MEEMLRSGPAGRRLSWLLDGLDGRWDPAVDATSVLSPEFAAQVSPARFVAVMTERATRLAPIRLVGLDVDSVLATARFRTADEVLWVAHVEVHARPPHQITRAYAQPSVPDDLTPRLPRDFGRPAAGRDVGEVGSGPAPVLLVFSGVPGSGKSTLAEQVGARLGLPVLALDWLLGALTPFGMRHRGDLLEVGEELLVTLAYRELRTGRSAVVDVNAEDPASRHRWESLAASFGARLQVVACVCSDRAEHRRRVEGRHRGIPGWHEAADWPDVTARLDALVPWAGAAEIDTVAGRDSCRDQVLALVAAG